MPISVLLQNILKYMGTKSDWSVLDKACATKDLDRENKPNNSEI